MNFDKEIVLFQQKVTSRDEALERLANEFLKEDVVNSDFYQGILEREAVFPTGILLENGIGVAIPHTEIDKVKSSQIGFMSLESPVEFYEMGQDNKKIEVSFIFMLALKEAHEHLETLQNLIGLFQDLELVDKLLKAVNKEQYLEIIHQAGLI